MTTDPVDADIESVANFLSGLIESVTPPRTEQEAHEDLLFVLTRLYFMARDD